MQHLKFLNLKTIDWEDLNGNDDLVIVLKLYANIFTNQRTWFKNNIGLLVLY